VKLKIANLPAVSLVETQKLANPNDTIVLKQSFATPGGTKFYRIELRNDLGAIRVMGITEKNSIEETDTLPKRDEDGGKVFYYNEDGEIVSAEAGTWLFGLKDNILHVYDYALSSEEGKDPTYTSITKIDLS